MPESFDLFIIDDDPAVIRVMLSLLSKYELTIRTFTDPDEGFKQLMQQPPKILFIDYNMPTTDGKKFIIKMSEHCLFQYTTVCLVSGMEFSNLTTIELHTLGFSEIIPKPIQEKVLLGALSNVLGEIHEKKCA